MLCSWPGWIEIKPNTLKILNDVPAVPVNQGICFWLAKDAFIVWEENSPVLVPGGFTKQDVRKYGDTHISLLRWTG